VGRDRDDAESKAIHNWLLPGTFVSSGRGFDGVDDLQRTHATKRLLEAEAELSALHIEQSKTAEESVAMIKTCLQFRARVSDYAFSAKRPSTRKAMVVWLCAVALMRTARSRIEWVTRVVKMRECREAFAGWTQAVWIARRQSQVHASRKIA
jgi:hypothetical protein